MNSKSIQAILVGLVFLSVSTIQCNWFKKEEDPTAPDYGIQVYPENGAVIWGYQILLIAYNSSFNIQVSDIKISIGGQMQSLIRDDNPMRHDLGEYNIEVDAETIPADNIQIIIEFVNNVASPIYLNYTINHMPVLEVTGEVSGNMIYLDAGSTVDPEEQPLSFTWKTGDSTFSTPQISVPIYQMLEHPVFISVTDGTTIVDDLVQYNPTSEEVTLVKDKLKCVNLDIAKDGQAMLPGDPPLGPMIAEGETLPVGADKKLTRDVMVGYSFEVRATLQPSAEILDEGQDVARTAVINIDGNHVTFIKKGVRRKDPNRSEYEPGQVEAPYPATIPPPAQPVLVEDSYDHHPRLAYYYVNTPTGIEVKSSDSKQLGDFVSVSYIVWSDQPGMTLKKGVDLSTGASYKAYFRSWLMPDLSLCQKYYTVEIEIDNTGKVTKNKLTVLP